MRDDTVTGAAASVDGRTHFSFTCLGHRISSNSHASTANGHRVADRDSNVHSRIYPLRDRHSGCSYP